MKRAVVIDGLRTAIGRRIRKRSFSRRASDDLAVAVVEALVERTGIDPAEVEDVVLGNTQQQGEQGLDVARIGGADGRLAGRPPAGRPSTGCADRACRRSNQATHAIMAGFEDVQIVGGLEHMQHIADGCRTSTSIPSCFTAPRRARLNMGMTAEFLAQTQGISREEQDAFALRSHQRAAAATAKGEFDREIVPVWGRDEAGNRMLVEIDQCIRPDTQPGGAGRAQARLHARHGHGHGRQ